MIKELWVATNELRQGVRLKLSALILMGETIVFLSANLLQGLQLAC